MNKHNLLKRIASVATELDQSGFTKEAKNMDLILLKLAQEEMEDANQGNLDNEDNGMGDAKKKLGPIDKIRGFMRGLAFKEKFSPEEEAKLNDLLINKFLPTLDEIDKIITFDDRTLKTLANMYGEKSHQDPKLKLFLKGFKIRISQASSTIENLKKQSDEGNVMSSKFLVRMILPRVAKGWYETFGSTELGNELKKCIFHSKGLETFKLYEELKLNSINYLKEACEIAGCNEKRQ